MNRYIRSGWSRESSHWLGYAAALILTAVASAIRIVADPWLRGVQFITFFPVIVFVAYAFGSGPGLTSAILSALISWYFLVPSRNSFQFAHPTEAYSLLLFLAVASIIALALGRAKATAQRLIKAQSALSSSEDRYTRIFHQVQDLIFTADLDLFITDCNPATAAALGVPIDRVVGSSIGEFVSEEGLKQARRMLDHKLEHGGTTRHDIEVRHSSGHLLTWEVSSCLALGEHEEVLGLHAIARDVTEQLQAAERQELLVHELNHRVKNTLALVQGLAHQSFNDQTDMISGREVFQKRLAALSKAHDLLTRENWQGATIRDVVLEATAHLGTAAKNVAIDGPSINIEAKAAVSLAMAVHELSTNAVKYGALSTGEGRVEVQWSGSSREDLSFEWNEIGGPHVVAPARQGFGLKLIQRVAASEFRGRAILEFNPEGFCCRICSSLPSVRA